MKKLPIHFENRHIAIYGSLMERIGASILDGLILAPLTFGMLYFNSLHLYNVIYTTLLLQVCLLVYTVYLQVRYGATPGKRIVGLTILKEDGSPITYRESFRRYLPSIVVGIIGLAFVSIGVFNADAAVYDNLNWTEQSKYLKSVNTVPLWVQSFFTFGFLLANVIIVGQNARSRSIGDHLAGTVVVNTNLLDRIEKYRKEAEAETTEGETD